MIASISPWRKAGLPARDGRYAPHQSRGAHQVQVARHPPRRLDLSPCTSRSPRNRPPSRRRRSPSPRSASRPHAAEWDETSHFPVDVIQRDGGARHGHHLRAGRAGRLRASRGIDGALIMEALAYGCPAISGYISIHNMVAWMVAQVRLATRRSQAWMPKLASMEWLSSYCLTEPGAGSDAAALKTSAKRSGDTTCSTAPSSSSPAPAPPTSISCSRARATRAPAASRRSR